MSDMAMRLLDVDCEKVYNCLLYDVQEELIENKPIIMWVHPVNANPFIGQKRMMFWKEVFLSVKL